MDYNSRAAAAIADTNQVGSVQKPYGKDGELVIRLWDTFPDNTEEPLWVEMDSLAVPIYISSLQMQGNTKAVVTFDDFETAAKAEIFIGKKLFSARPEIVEEEQDDWDFLVGYRFRDTTSGIEGQITGLIPNPLNPLIEVIIGGEEHLLPIADELVEKLDRKKRVIEMRMAEGIFEL